jgi:hypothetical protein
MKYAVQMGSGAMIYVPSFIESGSGIQKPIGEIQRHRQHGDSVSLLLFLQNKVSRLSTNYATTVCGSESFSDSMNECANVHYQIKTAKKKR